MDNIVLANEFVRFWKRSFKKHEEYLIQNWDNKTAFTSKILYDKEDSVIHSVSESLDLLYYSECRAGYYGIDAVLYKDKFLVPKINHEKWLRKIEIAFEHENEFNAELFKEISRLLITKCELKVLVTYPKGKMIKDNCYVKLLEGFKELFCGLDESLLVLLGFKNTQNNTIDWQVYNLSFSSLVEFSNL